MEVVSCDLCGLDNYEIILKVKDYRYHTTTDDFNLVKCKNCGLVYVNPRPTKKEEIRKFYPRDYYPSGGLITTAVKYFFRRNKVRKIKRYKKSGKLLDIGCGDGDFLFGMSQAGFEVFGLDTSVEACKISQQKLKNQDRIYNSEFKKCGFPDKFFDVITLSHVLEHLPHPAQELREISRTLKDDGIVFLGMPNIDSLAFKIFGRYWFHLDIPRHFYHFSSKTIRSILKFNGFQVIKMTYFSLGFPFSLFRSTLAWIKDHDMSHFLDKIIFIIATPFLFLLTVVFAFLFFSEWSQDLEVYCTKNNE